MLTAKLKAVGSLDHQRQPIETMIRQAVGYIVRNGPMTDQDRWEENAGSSPFTLRSGHFRPRGRRRPA